MRGPIKANKLLKVHTHLFEGDVSAIKRIADERGGRWQVELRQLVRRALKGEQREVVLLKEHR